MNAVACIEAPRPVIYKIRNVVNGKFYVGSSINSKLRFRQHRKLLRGNRHHCKHLQAAWNKYGEDCFKFEIVEHVEAVRNLQQAENCWLTEHVGKEHCYNSGTQADAPMRGRTGPKHPKFGVPISDAQRADISATLKAFYAAALENHPRWGKTLSPESRAKISANRKGKMAGAEHYRFGKTLNAEVRAKIGDTQRGVRRGPRVLSPEGLAKIRASAAAGNYSHFAGKRHTEEAKAKLRRTVRTVAPDGAETAYESITALREATGLLAPTVNRALKRGVPLAKGPYAGWSFFYGAALATPHSRCYNEKT